MAQKGGTAKRLILSAHRLKKEIHRAMTKKEATAKPVEKKVEAVKKPVSKPSSNPFLAQHPSSAGRMSKNAPRSGKKK